LLPLGEGYTAWHGENSDVSCTALVSGIRPVNVLRVAVIVMLSPAAGGVAVAVVPCARPFAFVVA
jgi:hypothetical protein